MSTIALFSKETGVVRVDSAQYDSDGSDGHGWSKKETEARGLKKATPEQIAADDARAAEAAKQTAAK